MHDLRPRVPGLVHLHRRAHRDPARPTERPGGRERTVNVLDRFAIDFGLCMYCGICVEVCPFDALHWSAEHTYPGSELRDLLHEQDRLASWLSSVPPPPPLDPSSRREQKS